MSSRYPPTISRFVGLTMGVLLTAILVEFLDRGGLRFGLSV